MNNTSNSTNSDDDYVEEIICINSIAYNNDGCSYTFKFGKTVDFAKGSKVGLVNCSMYNSTANISNAFGNNQMSITWIDGTVLSITLPNGYYAYSDLQNNIQDYLNKNNWYYTQNNVAMYAFQIDENIPLYKAQLNINPVPSAAQATSLGLTLPTGATWTWPENPITPQITFNTGLGQIMGFVNNLTFPRGGPVANVYAVTSDVFPIISPVYMYILSLNILNNNLNTANNQIFTSVPLNNSFGGLVTFGNGSNPQMVNIYPSRYTQITVRFLDQNLNPVTLIDPELSLLLILKYKP